MPPVDTKAADLLTHCVYQIATGKWAPETKLPSVRQAEEQWDLDRRTVLKAYRQLESQGLVTSRDRSGYYVAKRSELGRLSRHRFHLEELFERFAEEVGTATELSPVGVFHYFARLAEIRAREAPECAFVECTSTQAEGHAREVARRLGMPCLPMTLSDLAAGTVVPPHVQTLLVSGFHVPEAKELVKASAPIVPVAIEVAPDLTAEIPAGIERALVFESDETEAENIRADVQALGGMPPLETRVTDDVEASLSELFPGAETDNVLALLSPRLWGTVPATWRRRPSVREIAFRIREDAWPAIADAIGLPLGAYG